MNPNNDSQETPVDALDYLLVIVKYKWFILKTSVIVCLLSTIVSFLLPNIYISTARILIPQNNQSSLTAMFSGITDIAALAGLSPGAPGDLYVSLLNSRSVKDAIIKKFDLMEVYGEEYWVEMRERMDDIVTVSLGKNDGIITVSVEDEDSERAAKIANEYVRELQVIDLLINFERADLAREFYQERLLEVQTDLQIAENRLKEFQQKNNTIKIDAQAEAIIDAFSEIQSEIVKKEVELAALLSFQTEQNSEVKVLQEAIKQLNHQIENLESSMGQAGDVDFFMKTSEMPELAEQYTRLVRDLKVQEALFETMTQQLELSKISSEHKKSSIQKLDEAVAADKHSKPLRGLIILLATTITGLLTLVIAFFREYREQMSERDRKRWESIQKGLLLKKSTLDDRNV